VEYALKQLLPAHAANEMFKDSHVITDQLNGHRTSLDVLKGTVSCAGFYRLTPLYMDKEIRNMERELKHLNTNTLTTTRVADNLLKECA